MKVRICLTKDRTHGTRYFLKFKDFIFWHTLKTYSGYFDQNKVIYFDSLEAAEKYANDLIDESKIVVVKEISDENKV